MKTLQDIKDEVAKENGTEWNELLSDYGDNSDDIQDYTDEVAKRYAEEALREAAERSRFIYYDYDTNEKTFSELRQAGKDCYQIDKDVILNIIKELK
ncbi:MAG TPA: hypothetical protein VIQ00_11430 [Chitinophagaceae bacterium]